MVLVDAVALLYEDDTPHRGGKTLADRITSWDTCNPLLRPPCTGPVAHGKMDLFRNGGK